MQRLSEGARVIVHLLQNVGPAAGGSLPQDDIKVLFEGESKLFRDALKELGAKGFVSVRADGRLALTAAGAELRYLKDPLPTERAS
jgi:hypothetical protein